MQTVEPAQALLFPSGVAAREMEIGGDWEVLNLGMLFRQRRPGPWGWPDTMAPNRRVGFGLCCDADRPFGGVAPPVHFLGIRTQSSWTRSGLTNWWDTGWELTFASVVDTQTLGSGSGATLRVGAQGDDGGTAWYMRLTRSSGDLQVDLFLPTGHDSPQLFDFETQMERSTWKSSVNRHSTYRQTSLLIEDKQDILGELGAFNVFSNLRTSVSQELRAVELLAVKAVRLE